MESHGVVLFYEKCRLCLDKHGVEEIFKIEDLSQNILAFTGVKVSPSDNLPQKICSKCLEIIINAKELRLLATKNDVQLKSLFPKDDNEPESDIISQISDDLIHSTYFEPEIIINSNEEKKHKTKKKKVESEEICDSNFVTCKTEDEAIRKIKVRKDLFEPSASTNSLIKVQTKEDYAKVRKKIKLESDFDNVQYECGKCLRTYESWKKLYLHTRLHDKNKLCPLDGCGKKFATKGDLEKHLRTHTGVRPYTCDICEKSFTQQGTLKVHKESVHHSFILPS